MRLLLDTHLLLWAAEDSARRSKAARAMIEDPAAELIFSVASIWEVAVKHGLKRADFEVDPAELRLDLLAQAYVELTITGMHTLEVANLPLIHRELFDRIMLAQAVVEGALLLTSDARLASYPGPVQKV